MNHARNLLLGIFVLLLPTALRAQDTLKFVADPADTVLRIVNLQPFVTLHVDSTLRYQFELNKNEQNYFWYLRNAPVGLRINKDNGTLSFKAEKSYFTSGRLKFDQEYKIQLGVQNPKHPAERFDTSFTLLFFNTEVIPSAVQPTITQNVFLDEGDTLRFRIQCVNGSYPIEQISYFSNYPVRSLTPVQVCNDEFVWTPPFDFIRDNEKEKQKTLELVFVGQSRFNKRDSALVRVYVRDNVNYPLKLREYTFLRNEIEKYILQLKAGFRDVDLRLKKTKRTRTAFDLASASTALGGTVFTSMQDRNAQTAGKILPSVGVAMVPVKEASAPNSVSDQNIASLMRSGIKRLEYLLTDMTLVGDRDPDILPKTNKLRDELKQMQVQLIDAPLPDLSGLTKEELDAYFNSPRVNKKYQSRKRRKGN